MVILAIANDKRHPAFGRRSSRSDGGHGNATRLLLSVLAALRVSEHREPEEKADGGEDTAAHGHANHGALLPCSSHRNIHHDGRVDRVCRSIPRRAAII